MPSPVGHALAGAAVACGADLVDSRRSSAALIVTCAALAAAPDLDLLVDGFHRSATHSLAAIVIVFIVAAAVTDRVTRWRVALVCAAAWASHPLLDWLGADTFTPAGIQLLWPFDHRYFISGWDLFPETERYRPLRAIAIAKNLRALTAEVLIMGTAAGTLWLIRVKALARFPSEMTRSDQPAE